MTHLDHVQLAMPAGQEDTARAFYEGLLGLAWVAKPEHLARRGGCWFGDGDVKVHLGVEPWIVANALSAVLAQRLVRVICPHCKRPAKLERDLWDRPRTVAVVTRAAYRGMRPPRLS